MHIVEFIGGLGNQMFQYALFLKLQKVYGRDVRMNINYYNNAICHNGYELDSVFNLAAVPATREEEYYAGRKDIKAVAHNIFSNLYYRLYFKWKLSNCRFVKNTTNDANEYFEDIFNPCWRYYSGYWQNVKYFEDIKDEVKKVFKFPLLDVENLKLAELMGETNSVSIHIRRGDYLLVDHSFFQNICTDTYYKNAITYIKQHVEKPHFFVFSNDIDWCKSNLRLSRVTFVEGNVGRNSYKDMQLMSICKHNIIANSSFSWWGAWLNENQDKIVCAPNKWYSIKNSVSGECPKDWIRFNIG